jgi:hypothetical protein
MHSRFVNKTPSRILYLDLHIGATTVETAEEGRHARRFAWPMAAADTLRRLELSVEAQRRDNLRLQRLLAEMHCLRRLPPPPPAAARAAPAPAPTPAPAPPPVARAQASPRLAAPRAAGQAHRARTGAYGHSLDATFHRWRRRLVAQGVMAPLAGWRRYWAQWQIHALGRAFCGLRGRCRLRVLGRGARCFRALRLWERHVGARRLWRAWRAVGHTARHRRAALSARGFRRWSAECSERRRIRELVRQMVYRMQHSTVAGAILTWRAVVAATRERRRRVQLLMDSAVVRAQSLLLARGLEAWVEWSWEGRVERQRQRAGWRAWQLQRRRAAVHRRLLELINRMRRQSVTSVFYDWRRHVRRSIAARGIQAVARGLAARQSLVKTRAATRQLQRHWRGWLLRRRNRLLASAVSRLRFREMAGAWQGWKHAVHHSQRLRKALETAVARWQQTRLVEALGQWVDTHTIAASLRDMQLRVILRMRLAKLGRSWLQWVWTLQRGGRLRRAWEHWRQRCQLARVSQFQLELNAALQIQSFVRRSKRSRTAARERAAATVLQSVVRALLDRRSLQENLRLNDTSTGSSTSITTTTAVAVAAQSDGSASVDEPEDSGHLSVTDARALEAQSRAARAALQVQEHETPSSPLRANKSAQLSNVSIDEVAVVSLKHRFAELRRILSKMEAGDKLYMHRPNGRVLATVWVETDLQQLRWDLRDHQSDSYSHTRVEVAQAFSSIQRVCWGTGASPLLQDLRVRDPELCFSCQCIDGSWLDFEASDAAQLRRWVLGLQALVSKPGVALIDSSKLDWLLQQTRAAPLVEESSYRETALVPAASGIENHRDMNFDINQYLSECFDSLLAPHSNGCALVSALVDELVVTLNNPDTARQGIGREDLRALGRIQRALVHDYVSRGCLWINFTQLVQMLTSESDAEWARLYSNPRFNSLTSGPQSTQRDADSAALASVGLRMGTTCVPVASSIGLISESSIGLRAFHSFTMCHTVDCGNAELRSGCLCSSTKLCQNPSGCGDGAPWFGRLLADTARPEHPLVFSL